MNVKVFLTAALALFFIGFGASAMAVVFVKDNTATVQNLQGLINNTPSTPSEPTANQQTQEPATTAPSPTATPTPAPTPQTPKPVPAPVPTLTCGNGGSCTAAQVATHNTASNCWGIYNGKVYNLTSYVPKHDGGSAAFNSQSCGTDMTKYLNGSSGSGGVKAHNHSQKAYNILSSYYIANLQ